MAVVMAHIYIHTNIQNMSIQGLSLLPAKDDNRREQTWGTVGKRVYFITCLHGTGSAFVLSLYGQLEQWTFINCTIRFPRYLSTFQMCVFTIYYLIKIWGYYFYAIIIGVHMFDNKDLELLSFMASQHDLTFEERKVRPWLLVYICSCCTSYIRRYMHICDMWGQ